MKRFLKILHEIGSAGVMGTFAVCIVLAATAPTHSLTAYAAVRRGIVTLDEWVLVPSLGLVLVSGLLAIAATEAYKNAGWAWVKALLGISLFEGTLLTVVASAREAAKVSALAASGQGDTTQLAQFLHTEWGGLWMLFALSAANIVLGVWRPRLSKRRLRA